jgi:hypothetical protein
LIFCLLNQTDSLAIFCLLSLKPLPKSCFFIFYFFTFFIFRLFTLCLFVCFLVCFLVTLYMASQAALAAFRFCGVDGTAHDNNIIRCTKCRAINPILNPASRASNNPASRAPNTPTEEVVDLSESPPTTQSTTVFAAAERFKSYDQAAVNTLRQTATTRPAPESSTSRGGSRSTPASANKFDVIVNFHIQFYTLDGGLFRPTVLQLLGKILCSIIIYQD